MFLGGVEGCRVHPDPCLVTFSLTQNLTCLFTPSSVGCGLDDTSTTASDAAAFSSEEKQKLVAIGAPVAAPLEEQQLQHRGCAQGLAGNGLA